MSFKIFVIDEDPMMREKIRNFLSGKYADGEVSIFSTGEECLLELFRNPDVVVLDYHLDIGDSEAMNGIDILKRIKELAPQVPVLFLSNLDRPEIAENTIKYGAYDYIVKNENALHRLEIMINNSTGHVSVQKQLRRQTTFNIILLILLIVVLLSLLLSKFV